MQKRRARIVVGAIALGGLIAFVLRQQLIDLAIQPQAPTVRALARPETSKLSPTPPGKVQGVADERGPREEDRSRSDAGASSAANPLIAEEREVAALRSWLKANALSAEKNIERYCEQSKALSRLKVFLPPPGTRDAAVFLAIRVDWGDNDRRGLLHLPDTLTARMNSPPLNWLNFTEGDYAGLDFQWLAQLLDYDIWSITGDGPVKDQDQATTVAISPNWSMLQQWAKLRLVKGLREGDLDQATTEVNHLAMLCASTGILIGMQFSSSMYGIERKVWLAAGRQPPDSIPSADEVTTFRRVSMAGVSFLYPGVSPAVRARALECGLSRCASLTEAIGFSAAMRATLPEVGDDLRWLLAQHPCDQGLAERLSRGKPASLDELSSIFEEPPKIDVWLGDAGQ